MRLLIFSAETEQGKTFSYKLNWLHYFRQHPALKCTFIDLSQSKNNLYYKLLLSLGRHDAIVFMHSVFSNSNCLSPKLAGLIARRKCRKVFFMGNEYKLMPAKVELCRRLGIDLIVSQSMQPQAHALYRQALGCSVMGMPNSGLDRRYFNAVNPPMERPVDIGFRGADGPEYLGHRERLELTEFFLRRESELGLKTDISMEQSRRLGVEDWALFLNNCNAVLGVEAGSNFFELTDETRLKVIEYRKNFPDAGFERLRELFFDNRPAAVYGRMIASRHIEAAGTKTLQILFEGEYGGLFRPDVHYLALKKDFSNFGEVVERYRDKVFCRQIIDNAHRKVLESLTMEKLVDDFIGVLQNLR